MRKRKIGPYTVGEIPDPLTYTYRDRSGNPIDLTGMASAKVVLAHHGASVEIDAEIAADQTENGNRGQVTWTPADGDLDSAGGYELSFWVGNGGTVRRSSVTYWFNVDRGAGGVTPAI